MRRLSHLIVLFILLSLSPWAWAQKTLHAELERQRVEQGDLIHLRVIANFQTQTPGPDFSDLEADFEVLGVSASNQLRIVNGVYSATTQWDTQLIAKRPGQLSLPAFEVEGVRSQPITIEVSAPSQALSDYPMSFLQAQVDRTDPYLQSEVIYTLRYYHLGTLIRGSIDPPQFDGALVERLRNQHSFERRVQGRTYRVYEWVYALYPQHSGEWVIPPQRFEGELLHQRQLRLVSEQTQALTLQVKPIPPNYPDNQPWIAAKSLKLEQHWGEHPAALHVGDTLNRQIRLQAKGLKASQLPDPQWPPQTGLRLYADPLEQTEHLEDLSIYSVKTQNTTAVLQQAGKLNLQAIELPWWNTQTDQLEIARLDAREFDVLAKPAPLDTPTPEPAAENTPNPWPYISAALALAWLLTLYALWRRSRQPISPVQTSAAPTPTSSPTHLLFEQHGAARYHAIERWLAQQGVTNWRTLALSHPRLFALMHAFERHLFAAEAGDDFDSAALQHELNAFRPPKIAPTAPSPHKALYPTRGRTHGKEDL
jgi:hypothetical protein